jgi:hypothetical protein
VGLIGVLLFSWPAIGLLIKPPAQQEFSVIYLLGPNLTLGNIPYYIKAGETYSVYLGIDNHMGSSCYYASLVKFRSENHAIPNATVDESKSLPVLYEYNTFIQDGESWKTPLTFQIKTFTFADGVSYLPSITINGIEYHVNQSVAWNSNKTGYYYDLIVELWLYNSSLETFQYHNRSVHLILTIS